jgi:hypothetical protein
MENAAPTLVSIPIGTEDSASLLAQDETNISITPREIKRNEQAQEYVLMWCMYSVLVGFVLIGLASFTKESVPILAELAGLLGGIIAVSAICGGTTADLDLNAFLSKRSRLWAGFCVVIGFLLPVAIFLKVSKAGVVMMPPWIYAVIRFTPIINLEFGYPLPTDICSLGFLLVAFSFGCGYLANSGVSWTHLHVIGDQQEWGPSIALAGAMYLGMIFVGVMYRSAWSRGETPTVCFYMAVYAWLITNGVRSIMLDVFIRVYGYDADGGEMSRQNSSDFAMSSLNGPVYFTIPALTIMFRKSLYGVLGRRWAQDRMKDGAEIAEQTHDTHTAAGCKGSGLVRVRAPSIDTPLIEDWSELATIGVAPACNIM